MSWAPSADMTKGSQPDHQDEERLRHSSRRAAIIVALIALVATSGFFFTTAYQSERLHIALEATHAAELIAARITRDPENWRRNVEEIDVLLMGLHGVDEQGWHEIVDSSGTLVTRAGTYPGLLAPIGEARVEIGGHTVGIVRMGQLPHEVVKLVAVGLTLGLILSGCVIVVLWVLPMRVLNAAFGQTADYREALEIRVAELELTQDLLERQGAELSETADRLFHAREKEREANKAKSEFLANMSHELRTPLNSIIGFSEIMQLESFGPIENERYREYSGHIHASGNHLLGLINDMLDLAKVEAGKLELEEQALDFAYLVRGCRKLLEQRIANGGLEFAELIPIRLPMLMADERKLRQILFNLLSNAINHTPPAGRIFVQAWVDPAGQFLFSVTDTGVGMAAEDIPKALEPFGQVDNPMVTGEEGTGLGLPLTKALVELHGGTIALQSAPQKGTTA